MIIGGGRAKRKICHISVLRGGLWLPMCNRQHPANHDTHQREVRPATPAEIEAFPVCQQCAYQLGDVSRPVGRRA